MSCMCSNRVGREPEPELPFFDAKQGFSSSNPLLFKCWPQSYNKEHISSHFLHPCISANIFFVSLDKTQGPAPLFLRTGLHTLTQWCLSAILTEVVIGTLSAPWVAQMWRKHCLGTFIYVLPQKEQTRSLECHIFLHMNLGVFDIWKHGLLFGFFSKILLQLDSYKTLLLTWYLDDRGPLPFLG